MRFGVDLPLQDFLRTGNRACGNLAAQLLTRPVRFLFDLGERGRYLPLALLRAVCFAFGDDLVGTRMRLVEDRRRLLARIGDDVLRFDLRLVETLLPALGGAGPLLPRARVAEH